MILCKWDLEVDKVIVSRFKSGAMTKSAFRKAVGRILPFVFLFTMFSSCEKDNLDPGLIIDELTPAFRITGDYFVKGNCGDYTDFEMRIEPFESKADEVIMHNFLGRGFTTHAFHKEDRFVIPRQTYRTDIETIHVEGNLYESPAEGVILVYRMQSMFDTEHCTATCTKTVPTKE